MSRSGTTTPRSRSRSKRSTTNLADLRLAPLSAKFVEPPAHPKTPKSPYDETPDAYFSRQHPSYLLGKSAPTSPSVLSRSSSRRRQSGGGLSRKSGVFDHEDDADDEVSYTYNAPSRSFGTGERVEFGSGEVPKAKSEATLTNAYSFHQHRRGLSGTGIPVSKRHRYPPRSKSGAVTPRNEYGQRQDSWLTHTGAAASALIQEDKGLSWLASRANATSVAPPESEDDDDDQYEEMAALSASTAQLQLAEFNGGSPMSTRVSRWGSRYGSRSASRRTSRFASPVGTRTPRRGDPTGYFDDYEAETPVEEKGFQNPKELDENLQDQQEVERLSAANSFGLGTIVDRLMNFNIFKGDEGHETTTDDEAAAQAKDDESPEKAKERLVADAKRKREEKAKLTQAPPAPTGDGEDGEKVAGWTDAAWLLSVASKAMF